MSYSTCLKCEQMVSAYEKYCDPCVDEFHLEQDKDYWKNKYYPERPQRFLIIQSDLIRANKNIFDLLQESKDFMAHNRNCSIQYHEHGTCSCGLSDFLLKIK